MSEKNVKRKFKKTVITNIDLSMAQKVGIGIQDSKVKCLNPHKRSSKNLIFYTIIYKDILKDKIIIKQIKKRSHSSPRTSI